MKQKDKFDKNWAILVKAYLNGTLEHGCPCGCAVGNLIAANMGYTPWEGDEDVDWPQASAAWYDTRYRRAYKYTGLAKVQIDSTGYSFDEVWRIEKAFERAYYPAPDPQFLGLSAVLDVLLDIHESEVEEAEETRAQFFALKK